MEVSKHAKEGQVAPSQRPPAASPRLDAGKRNFVAIKDRVIIHPEAEELSSSIIIPDSVDKKIIRGLVVSIGPDVTSVKEGDLVIYDSYRCGTMVMGENLFHVARDIAEGQIDAIIG